MRYILAIFLPPLAVLTTGRLGAFLLNIILCFIFWIPGIIHAMIVIADYNSDKKINKIMRNMGR